MRHLYESRMFWPLNEELFHLVLQILQHLETPGGISNVCILVNVQGLEMDRLELVEIKLQFVII